MRYLRVRDPVSGQPRRTTGYRRIAATVDLFVDTDKISWDGFREVAIKAASQYFQRGEVRRYGPGELRRRQSAGAA